MEGSVHLKEDIMDAPIAIVALGKEFRTRVIKDSNNRGLWFLSFADKGIDIQVNYSTAESDFDKGFGIYDGVGNPLYEGLNIEEAIEAVQDVVTPKPKDNQVVIYYWGGKQHNGIYIEDDDMFYTDSTNWSFRIHIDSWKPVFDEDGKEVINDVPVP